MTNPAIQVPTYVPKESEIMLKREIIAFEGLTRCEYQFLFVCGAVASMLINHLQEKKWETERLPA